MDDLAIVPRTVYYCYVVVVAVADAVDAVGAVGAACSGGHGLWQ